MPKWNQWMSLHVIHGQHCTVIKIQGAWTTPSILDNTEWQMH